MREQEIVESWWPENNFKWSATTHQVEKWVFDEVVQTYLCNKENPKWLRQNNPYALEEITRRLMEAESRGLWVADEDFLADVQEVALMIEGIWKSAWAR
jgi:cobaltochelatase CobN